MKRDTITTQFTLNDDYWAGSLRTLYRYKRPFRHYQPLIGAAVLAFGIILAVILPGTRILPFAVILVGVIETIEPFIIKWRFMRDFRSNPSRGGTITFEFGEESFKMRTPTSEGEIKWSAALEVLQTPAGLLIFLQPRLHYFVPAEAFSQVTQMAEVTARFRAANVKTRIFDPRVRG